MTTPLADSQLGSNRAWSGVESHKPITYEVRAPRLLLHFPSRSRLPSPGGIHPLGSLGASTNHARHPASGPGDPPTMSTSMCQHRQEYAG